MLEENLGSIRALRQLHDRAYNASLDAVSLYDLVLLATEDEVQARAAMQKRALERQRLGLKP